MLELRSSKWKTSVLLVGCLGFVAIGVLMANDASSKRPADQSFWAWTCIAFFGLGVLVALRELLRTGPRLIISDAGIEDRANDLGLIPWSEIADVEVRTIRGTAILSLVLRNPEPWVARLPTRFRWLVSANRALGFAEINVTISGLTKAPTEVFDEVRRHLGS